MHNGEGSIIMKSIWFISDLHLDVSRPDAVRQFLDLLPVLSRDARALYVLGDFFEYWIGGVFPTEFPPVQRPSSLGCSRDHDHVFGDDFDLLSI